MKVLFYIFLVFQTAYLFSQSNHDENIKALIHQYSVKPELKCEILVKIDIEGMSIPNKKIIVDFKNGEKPKVKGKGLSLLPKKGTINQFGELLSSPLQAIYLSKNKNKLEYKLVSLDQKSDWITADIVFDIKTFVIYESTVNTRKFGTFNAKHFYQKGIYPSKSIITFDIKKFKIPLKFIGREQQVSKTSKAKENVQGKIILNYNYL